MPELNPAKPCSLPRYFTGDFKNDIKIKFYRNGLLATLSENF